MTAERRAGGEVRIAGRTLTGIAMPYGTVSPDFAERFEAGAFAPVAAVGLNLQHDRGITLVEPGGLDLRDGPAALEVRAELPEGAAALVRRRALRGLSVEFNATSERLEGGVRVVERAELAGLGLVDRPAYPAATVEVRARSGRTLRARVPADTKLQCECSRDSKWATIIEPALEDMWEKSFTGATRQVVAAYLEDYGTPLASTARGTLRGRIRGAGGYEVDIDLPDSEAGRSLLAAWDDSGIIVRPFIADQQSSIVDGVNVITGGRLRAFIVSATDAREGWPEPEFVPTPDMDGERAAPERRRRIWL